MNVTPEKSDTARLLARSLADARSGSVVFLSHCLLNEHTRYLGGAARPACVDEVVAKCVDARLGMIQMPCPEQSAWGGVLKRKFLSLYGWRRRHRRLGRLLAPLLWRGAALYSTLAYRRLARGVARDIEDYTQAGIEVRAVVSVDASPSCGLSTRVDFRALETYIDLDPARTTPEEQTAIVRRYIRPGAGTFTRELQRALGQRGVLVPFVAHDLLAEFEGHPTSLELPPPGTRSTR